MDLDKIEKLNELKEKGMISDEEYQRAKAKALGSASASDVVGDVDNRSYSMLMHLAQLCGFVIPMCGLVVPLIMWVVKKDDAYINEQGKVVFNWVISSFIYFVICIVLAIFIIGIFLVIALGIVSIVFIIMGAIRAKDGTIQNYPMSIPFFTVDPGAVEKAEALEKKD
ncbi:DUF4870 domain-containing protein [Gilvimarinus xylanilyticus]|uniref:DUF4870 domain-containing protein n=1 Tax=Gilvimarinus xylanilyticus TaxID=2944139 RepID=A0A9X2HYW5_9GAMM|nr:DUF4870 domain-containing protein [Gilvimarinus xylanilyticus]MCP8900595.1 DUF4870 domain-containing protein [Gilvimarinus xylanilyticus]